MLADVLPDDLMALDECGLPFSSRGAKPLLPVTVLDVVKMLLGVATDAAALLGARWSRPCPPA